MFLGSRSGVGLTKELNHSINQRRKQEQHWETFNAIKQTDAKHRFAAEWESKTTTKIQKGQLQKRLDELRKEKEKDLERRRNKLAEKLALEDEQFKQELESMQETTEERRRKLEQRAK